MKIYEEYGLADQADLNTTEVFTTGIECELESFKDCKIDLEDIGFKYDHDGSLRNNGAELISFPMPATKMLESFKKLHANIVFKNKSEAFSSRTSTHIHINCRTLDTSQVKQLVLLYALFEELFFLQVNPDRRNNIHCVPLVETHLPIMYRHHLGAMRERWHKYTALNILPLATYGTVEFRHLHGTNDDFLLDKWLKILENLWTLAKTEPISPKTLIDDECVMEWFTYIFQGSDVYTMVRPSLKNIIADTLLDVKFAFV